MAKDYTQFEKEELVELMQRADRTTTHGLVWEPKPEKVVTMCQKNLPILKVAPERDLEKNAGDIEHVLIEGDNYHALSVLSYTHKERVDVVYIDPPYNTGNKDFKYNDAYVDEEDSYRHSKWLSFMQKRLELSRELLSDEGVIIVHIDEHEIDRLYLLLIDIFGDKNDLGRVVWNKKNPKGDSHGVSIMHESVLCFAKNKERFLQLPNILKKRKANADAILTKAEALFKKLGQTDIPEDVKVVLKSLEFPDEQLNALKVTYDLDIINKEFQAWLKRQDFSSGERMYKYIDENGEVYRGVSMAWPNKKKAPDEYFEPLIHPKTGKACPIPARGWRNPPGTMEKLLKDGMILFGDDEKKQPERKYLLKENLLENTPSIFAYGASDDKLFDSLDINFPYAKPVAVAKYFIQAIHPSPSIVMDSFAGSGTAGQAVLEINKEQGKNMQFILCTDDEEKIITDVCHPRLERVMHGYKAFEKLGGVLKYFKTGFVSIENITDISDEERIELTYQAGRMIALKEGTSREVEKSDYWQIFNGGAQTTAIYFKEDKQKLQELVDRLSEEDEVALYIFSWGMNEYKAEFSTYRNIRVEDIPQPILEVYKEINRR